MSKNSLLALVAGALVLLACGGSRQQDALPTVVTAQQQETGDSTIYGLACDGSTDTILVILCDIKDTPDTFNILKASRMHNVFGSINIGDKVAVVRNPVDTTVADVVVDLESMRGKWCYEVMPTLRRRADEPDKSEQQLLREMPDSVRDSLMVPHEYGFEILGERSIRALGVRYGALSSDEESLVIYPEQRRYHDWHLYNGQLVLNETATDSLGGQYVSLSDTADFVMLRPDTLVLRFNNGVRGFYRKWE